MNRGIKAGGAGKASKNSSIFKAPIRILTKARDFYIRSFSECAGRVDFNGGLGCPAVHVSTLPRSYSVSSSTGSYSSARDDDFSELVRIASARGLAKKVEAEVLRRRRSTGGGDGREGMTRSQSVGIGRIDEDKACDFDDDDDNKVKVDVLMYPRSKSHTPLSTRNGLF